MRPLPAATTTADLLLAPMHQPVDHDHASHDDSTLRLALRRAVALDLNLPEHHAAVATTMNMLAATAKVRPDTECTLDTWWRVVAHTHALAAK